MLKPAASPPPLPDPPPPGAPVVEHLEWAAEASARDDSRPRHRIQFDRPRAEDHAWLDATARRFARRYLADLRILALRGVVGDADERRCRHNAFLWHITGRAHHHALSLIATALRRLNRQPRPPKSAEVGLLTVAPINGPNVPAHADPGLRTAASVTR